MVMLQVNSIKGPDNPNPFLSGFVSGIFGPFSEEEVEARMATLGWIRDHGHIGSPWRPPNQEGLDSNSVVSIVPIKSSEFPVIEPIYKKRYDTGGF